MYPYSLVSYAGLLLTVVRMPSPIRNDILMQVCWFVCLYVCWLYQVCIQFCLHKLLTPYCSYILSPWLRLNIHFRCTPHLDQWHRIHRIHYHFTLWYLLLILPFVPTFTPYHGTEYKHKKRQLLNCLVFILIL